MGQFWPDRLSANRTAFIAGNVRLQPRRRHNPTSRRRLQTPVRQSGQGGGQLLQQRICRIPLDGENVKVATGRPRQLRRRREPLSVARVKWISPKGLGHLTLFELSAAHEQVGAPTKIRRLEPTLLPADPGGLECDAADDAHVARTGILQRFDKEPRSVGPVRMREEYRDEVGKSPGVGIQFDGIEEHGPKPPTLLSHQIKLREHSSRRLIEIARLKRPTPKTGTRWCLSIQNGSKVLRPLTRSHLGNLTVKRPAAQPRAVPRLSESVGCARTARRLKRLLGFRRLCALLDTLLKDLPNLRPFRRQDTEDDRITEASIWQYPVMPENSLLRGPKLQEGGARLRILRMSQELNPIHTQCRERVFEKQQLRGRIDEGALPGFREPCRSNLQTLVFLDDVEVPRRSDYTARLS